MEIRQLEVFLVVAEELHFARASERLHLAQSSVSSAVSSIERELGGAVFDRSNRRVALTPAGRLLVERATEIVRARDDAVRDVTALIAGVTGELRVGYSFAAVFALEDLTRRVHEAQSSLRLNPIELYGPLAHTALLDGEIDLGLIWFAEPHADLSATAIAERPFVAILRRDHPLADNSEIALADLAEEDFVLSPRTQNPGFYDAIGERCATAGFTPTIRQHVGGFRSVRTIVGTSGGVGITVDTATIDVDLGDTVAVRLNDAAPAILSVATRVDAPPSVRETASLLPSLTT
ncbi:MAG: LysR family transcriptional regulator [Actinomycetota bacterium]